MSGFASIIGSNGDDNIVAPLNGSQFIDGNAGDDFIAGLRGNDIILGDAGDDSLFGGHGADTIYGGLGNDLIDGGVTRDLIFGGNGADTIFGGNGDDTIYGGRGLDLIVGGNGDDQMRGGQGEDIFDFGNQFGHDLIIGFQIGVDLLVISSNINGTGVAAPADLVPLVSTDPNGNAVITLGTDTITLQGVSPADVTANISGIVTIV
jgi:Ca2+-binding RTX toxin-like protein